MKDFVKILIGIILLQTLALYVVLSRTPEVTLKATDHISCDEYGYEGKGPVEVQFQLGTYDKRILIIKTQAKDWNQSQAICNSWNDIGYELEK